MWNNSSGGSMGGSSGSGSTLSNMMNSQMFWEGAFLLALILIIGAHKITVEGMIGV
jgi:hypothetical protein